MAKRSGPGGKGPTPGSEAAADGVDAPGAETDQVYQTLPSEDRPTLDLGPGAVPAALVEAGPGELGGGVRFVEVLGRGGMGTVELVEDGALRRRIARKVLHEQFRGRPGLIASFVNEARVTAQLDHPSIVPVHDLGIDPDLGPYFTMKRVEGETFDTYLRRLPSPLDWDSVFGMVEIVARVCDALALAHERGTLHCDVKPSNVMVGRFGEVYLMDWGLAHPMREPPPDPRDASWSGLEPSQLGSTRSIRGTPCYMPPEQARAEPLDARSDVYTVGGLLYFGLTGRVPHPGTHPDEMLVSARLIPVPPVLEVAAPGTVPPELARIVDKALAADPAKRQQQIGDLRQELGRFMRGGGDFPERRVSAGSHLVREGETGEEAFILRAGKVEVYRTVDGREVHLREMGAGEVLGEMALLCGSRRTASVRVLEDVVALVVTREVFERELGSMKPWMGAFFRTLAQRFRDLEDSLL